MLSTFALFSGCGLRIRARGDLVHHMVEDTGIALGNALSQALGDRRDIERFGYAVVPMDDALVMVSIDLVRRPYVSVDLGLDGVMIEDLEGGLIDHFYRSLAYYTPFTLHIARLRGRDPHHIAEASFKSFAIAISQAWRIRGGTPRGSYTPSVKGEM